MIFRQVQRLNYGLAKTSSRHIFFYFIFVLFIPSSHLLFVEMATAPTLRKRNQLYQNRAMKGTVAAKAQEKSKAANKPPFPYWAIALLMFALFGGIILQLIDYFF